MRFTIEEYAKAYSISPDMVLSRLRRNRLNYIIENDTTYIVVPKHQVPQNNHVHEELKPVAKKTTVATVIGLYQKENHYLKLKIEALEKKVDRLISEKENLLREERERIEKVYMDKDAQLKSILELLNTKMLQESKSAMASGLSQTLSDDAYHAKNLAIEANIENEVSSTEDETGPVELKQYLRSLGLKSLQRKAIKRRFAEAFGTDSRILLQNGAFLLDFDRYDYSDLLKTNQG